MSKSAKIVLGFLTILPLIYFVVFISYVVVTISGALRSGGAPGDLPIFPNFYVLFVLHMIVMILLIGLTIFYIVNVFRNDRVHENRKVLWAVVLFMGNIFAMPIYWYLHIWSEPKPVVDGTGATAG